MKTTKRFVIDSTDLFRSPPIARPAAVAYRAASRGSSQTVGGEWMLARSIQALLGLGALGAVAHEAFGVGGAVVLTLLVLPVLALVLINWASKSGSSSLSKLLPSSTSGTALILPALALPGALLGWIGLAGLVFAAAVACVALAA